MKKTALIMAAMLSAAVSCTKEQIHEEKSDKPEIEAPGESKGSIPMEFTAVSDLTRTSIGELNRGKREISWVKDDEIKIITTTKALPRRLRQREPPPYSRPMLTRLRLTMRSILLLRPRSRRTGRGKWRFQPSRMSAADSDPPTMQRPWQRTAILRSGIYVVG